MGDGFFELIFIVILFLSSIPFIFQFKYGSRALWGWTKLPFWKICSISFIGQFLIAIIIFTVFYIINPKDGIYYVFFLYFDWFFIFSIYSDSYFISMDDK
jgi:hypothetical protein